jgi:hypothetical protein
MPEHVKPAIPGTADDYARQIKSIWQKAVESIIETGRLLIKAKTALKDKQGHGKWLSMFDESNKNKLPFGERTAQMLMEIAEHPILSNPKFTSVLPASWYTLYRLTKLPDDELTTILADGTITSDTTSKDADKIIEKLREDGLYLYSRVTEALNILIRFMEKWPDASFIAAYVFDEMERVGYRFDRE